MSHDHHMRRGRDQRPAEIGVDCEVVECGVRWELFALRRGPAFLVASVAPVFSGTPTLVALVSTCKVPLLEARHAPGTEGPSSIVSPLEGVGGIFSGTGGGVAPGASSCAAFVVSINLRIGQCDYTCTSVRPNRNQGAMIFQIRRYFCWPFYLPMIFSHKQK